MIFKVPSNPYHSVFFFYGSISGQILLGSTCLFALIGTRYLKCHWIAGMLHTVTIYF